MGLFPACSPTFADFYPIASGRCVREKTATGRPIPQARWRATPRSIACLQAPDRQFFDRTLVILWSDGLMSATVESAGHCLWRAQATKWRTWRDSNPRHPVPKFGRKEGAACSLLFVNIRLWPESGGNLAGSTRANSDEGRRTMKKDAERMHLKRSDGAEDEMTER